MTPVNLAEYTAAVLKFANQVEAFYLNSKPRVFEDAVDEADYAAFWREWYRRREAAMSGHTGHI
jgi:hypothetical protein